MSPSRLRPSNPRFILYLLGFQRNAVLVPPSKYPLKPTENFFCPPPGLRRLSTPRAGLKGRGKSEEGRGKRDGGTGNGLDLLALEVFEDVALKESRATEEAHFRL